MAIDKKLIGFKTKAQFNIMKNRGELSSSSVVFIEDTGEIYTHNNFYGVARSALSDYVTLATNQTITGTKIFSYNNGSRTTTLNGASILITSDRSTAWANSLAFTTYDGSSILASFGAYGSSPTTLNYAYIGDSYSNPWVKFQSSMLTSLVPITATNVTVNGSLNCSVNGIRIPMTGVGDISTHLGAIHTGEDGATLTKANVRFGSWYGFGWYPTIGGQPVAQGTHAMWLDARSGNLTIVGKFIKNGGTSSQFLKADGSIDSNAYLTVAGTINYAYYLSFNNRMTYGWNGVNYFNANLPLGANPNANDAPSATHWHILRFNHANVSGYYTDLAVPLSDYGIYYKNIRGGAVAKGKWIKMWDELDFNPNNYLPLSGGLMSGTLTINTSGTGAYNQGIRINRPTASDWATLTLGYVGSGTSNTSSNMWLIGVTGNDLIFNNNAATPTLGLHLQAGHPLNGITWNNSTIWHAGNLNPSGYMKTDGRNTFVTLTGGDGNNPGWRKVYEFTVTRDWSINSTTLIVNSRHSGTGIVTITFHTIDNDSTAYSGELRYYGSLIGLNGMWKAFYNTATKIFRAFWYYSDYSNCDITVLNSSGNFVVAMPTNGVWQSATPGSENGSELPLYVDTSTYTQQLLYSRTINGTGFNGGSDITTSYWGTSRLFYVYDYNNSNSSSGVWVNGSDTTNLSLPSSAYFSNLYIGSTSNKWIMGMSGNSLLFSPDSLNSSTGLQMNKNGTLYWRNSEVALTSTIQNWVTSQGFWTSVPESIAVDSMITPGIGIYSYFGYGNFLTEMSCAVNVYQNYKVPMFTITNTSSSFGTDVYQERWRFDACGLKPIKEFRIRNSANWFSWTNVKEITEVLWSNVSDIPTTLSGYGITNALSTSGGTVTPESRIAQSSGDLYIGSASNIGYLKVQDICSQLSVTNWKITQTGIANFAGLTVGSNIMNGTNYRLLANYSGWMFQVNNSNTGSSTRAITGTGYIGVAGQANISSGYGGTFSSFNSDNAYIALWCNGRAGGSRAWNDNSDFNLKYNISGLLDEPSILEKAAKLRLVSFKWRDNGESSYGAIAQEVGIYFPELIRKDPNGNLCMPYNSLFTLKIASNEYRIQELEKEVSNLKLRISTLLLDMGNTVVE